MDHNMRYGSQASAFVMAQYMMLLDAAVQLMHPQATIRMLGRTEVHGHAAIWSLLLQWRFWFEGATFSDINIQPAPDMIAAQRGAAECFIAQFTMSARYAQTLPGFETLLPANGNAFTTDCREIIWLNHDGDIIYVDINVNLENLRAE